MAARKPSGTKRIPISQLASIASKSVKGRDPRKLRPPTGPTKARVLGVDPGSRVTGYGIVEINGTRLNHVASGIIKAYKPGVTFEDRLVTIHKELDALIKLHKPDAAAAEGVFTHRNAQSALKLGHARGVILLTARLNNLSVAEYAPTRIKQAVVGHGSADKTQVQKMISMLLGIPAPKKLDTSDALAIAICHLHSLAPGRMFGGLG